jgi:hypothetical protein
MTLLELIRLRLSEAEKEPITPSEGMIIDAVDALSDYVECQGALAHGDMRRWCWIAAYVSKLGTGDCRRDATTAAHQAVIDFDAFVTGEVQP